jgi:RNA polymerase-binding transcription factor DksA
MTTTDTIEVAAVRARLTARLTELRTKLATALVPEPEESFGSIAGEVRDAGDESVAAERIDVRNALMERDAREIGGLERALARLDDGTYGTCVECRLEIETARLEALPVAGRCIHCQAVFEKHSAAAPTL